MDTNMLSFSKEELEDILYIMDDWDSPMRHEPRWMNLKNKVYDQIEHHERQEKTATKF